MESVVVVAPTTLPPSSFASARIDPAAGGGIDPHDFARAVITNSAAVAAAMTYEERDGAFVALPWL